MLQDEPKVKPNLEEIQWSKEKEKNKKENQKEKRIEINFMGFIRVVQVACGLTLIACLDGWGVEENRVERRRVS